MKTFGDILDENGGVGPGFDAIRLILAFSVIIWHCFPLTNGSADPFKDTAFWPVIYSLVPMFFILSGFLVTGSALRLSLKNFVISRCLRIFPALLVDTIVTVFLIGFLLTNIGYREYFFHPQTIGYLWNIVGKITYYLPGVFESNPQQAVNGSLWTIKPELGCYIAIASVMVLGWITDWKKISFVLFFVVVILSIANFAHGQGYSFKGLNIMVSDGAKLVPLFLSGCIMYLLRYKIPYSLSSFILIALFYCSFGFILDYKNNWNSLIWISMTAPLLSYIVLFLGLTKINNIRVFSRGDYSYGIYLYAFPIQQAVIQLTETRNPIIVFALTFVPVVAFAMFSWHFVEKPMLRFRKRFSIVAKNH